jgi:hypothetical protein
LSAASQAEPRIGIAYNVKPTNTVLRIPYARSLETPFNENLIISTTGCDVSVIAALIPCVPANSPTGYRNEFHAGLEQAFGKYLLLDGEYIWKYTHNAYDFSVRGNTPITFPIDWHNSKIPGFLVRAGMPNFHGFTALVVMSSVAARFSAASRRVGRDSRARRVGFPHRSRWKGLTNPRICNISPGRAVRG